MKSEAGFPAQSREGATNATAEKINEIAACVLDAAFEVHRELGAGLLESAYCAALEIELKQRGVDVLRECAVPCYYKGMPLGITYRMDLVAADAVVIEVKAVQDLLPVHHAQLLTYLRLSGHRLGLLINFNVPLLKGSIKRVVNKL